MSNDKAQPPRSWVQGIRDHLVLALLAAVLLSLVEGWYYGKNIEQRITRIEVELENLEQAVTPGHK